MEKREYRFNSKRRVTRLYRFAPPGRCLHGTAEVRRTPDTDPPSCEKNKHTRGETRHSENKGSRELSSGFLIRTELYL